MMWRGIPNNQTDRQIFAEIVPDPPREDIGADNDFLDAELE